MASRTAIHLRALVFASVILLCLYVGPKQHSQLHNRWKRALSVDSDYTTEDSPSSPIALQVKSTLNVVDTETNYVPIISLFSDEENQSPKSSKILQLFSRKNDSKKHILVNNKSLQKTVTSNRHLLSLRESNLEHLINASIQHSTPRYISTSYSDSSNTIEMDTKENHFRPKKRKVRSSHIPKKTSTNVLKPNRHTNNSVTFDTKSIVVKLHASTLLRKNIIALLGSMLFNSKTTIPEELYISLLNIYDAFRMRRLHTLDFIHVLAEMMHKPLKMQFAVFFHELEKHSPEYLKWDVIAWRAATFGNMSDVKELVTLELSKQKIDFLSGINKTYVNIVQNHTVFTQSTVDDSLDWVVSITGNFYANIIGIITEGNLIMTKELFVYVMLQLPCETFSPEVEETRNYIADVLLNEDNYHFKVKYTQIQTEHEPDPYKLIQSVLIQIKIQFPKEKSFEELIRSINILISYMSPPRLSTRLKGTEYSINALSVNYTEAFNIVTPSEFPVDVVQCKNDILLFIQVNHLNFSSIMKMSEMYKIKSSRELLIALLSKFRRNLKMPPKSSSCINTLRSHIIRKYDLWEMYSCTKSNYNRKSLILEAFQSPYLPRNAYNVTSNIISKLDREYPSWQNEGNDVMYQTPPRYFFLKLALSINRNTTISGLSNIQASLNDFIDYFNTLQTIHIQCKNECSAAKGRSLPIPSAAAHGDYKSDITDKNNSLYDATTVPVKISKDLHILNSPYTLNSRDELEENFPPSLTNAIEIRRQTPTENPLNMKEIYYDPFYIHSSVYFTQKMPTSYQFDHGNTNEESNSVINSSSISANNVGTYPSPLTKPIFSEEINQEYAVISNVPHKGMFSHFVPTTLYEDPNSVSNITNEEPGRTNSSQPPQKIEMILKNETYIISMRNETLRAGAIKLSRKLCEITQQCLTSNQDELNGAIKLCNIHFEEIMLNRPSSTSIKMLLQSLPRNLERDKIHNLEMFLNSPNISQMLGNKFIMTTFPSLKQFMFGLLKHSLSLPYVINKPELYDVLRYFDKALMEELDNSQDTKDNKIFIQNMHTVFNDTDRNNNVNVGYNFLNLNEIEFVNSLLMFNLVNSTYSQQLNKLIKFLDAMNTSDSIISCCNMSPGFVFKTVPMCIINRSLTLDSDKMIIEHLKTFDYFHKLLDEDYHTNYSKTLTHTDVASLLSELPFSPDSKKYRPVISLLLNPYFINILGTSFNASLYNSTKELLRAIINHCLSSGSLQSEPNFIEALHFYDNLLQDSLSNINDNMLFDESTLRGNSLLEPELKGIIKQAHEILSFGNHSELQEIIKYYHELLLELQPRKLQECVTKLLNETSSPTLTEVENKSTMFPDYRPLLHNFFLEAIRMKYVTGNPQLLNNLYECRIFLNSSLTNHKSELPENNSVSSNAKSRLSEEITTLPSFLNAQVQSNFSSISGKSFNVTQDNKRNDLMKDIFSHSSAEEAVVRKNTSPKLFELFENKATTVTAPVPTNLSDWSNLQDKNLAITSRHLKHHKTTPIIPDHSYEKHIEKLKDKHGHNKYKNEQVYHKNVNAILNTVSGQSLTTLDHYSEVFTATTEAIGQGERNSEPKPKPSFSGKKIADENYFTEHDLSNAFNFKASNNDKTLKLEKLVDDKDTHDTYLYNRSSLDEVNNAGGLNTNTFQEFKTNNNIDKKRNFYRTSIPPRAKIKHLNPFTFRMIVPNISSNGMEETKIHLLFGNSTRLLGSKYINKHPNKQYIFNKQSRTYHSVNKTRENNDTFRKSNHSTMLFSSGGVITTANVKAATTNKMPVDPEPSDDISNKWYYKSQIDKETSETHIEIKVYSDGNGTDNPLHFAQTQILAPYKTFTGTDQNKSEIMNNNLSFNYFSELSTTNNMLSEQRNTEFGTDFSHSTYYGEHVTMDLPNDRNFQNTNNISVRSRFQEYESGIDSSMVPKNDDIKDPNVNNNMTTYVNNSPLMQSVGFDSNNLRTVNISGMNNSLNYFENRQVDVNFPIKTDEIEHISSPQIIKYSDVSDNVKLSRTNIDETKNAKAGLDVDQSEPNATERKSFPNMKPQSIGLYRLNVSVSLSSTQSSAQHEARIMETTTNTQQANNDDHPTERNQLEIGFKTLFSSLNPRHDTTIKIFATPSSTSYKEISIIKMASKLPFQVSNDYKTKTYFTGIINTTSNENLFDEISHKIEEKEVAVVDDKEPYFSQSTTSNYETEIRKPNEIFAKSNSKIISYFKEIEHDSHDTNIKYPDRDALLCLNSTTKNCKHNNYYEKESFYNENIKSYTRSTTDELSPYATYNDITGETTINSNFISPSFNSHRPSTVERSNVVGTDSPDSESNLNMTEHISATEKTYYNNQSSTKNENLYYTISSRKNFIITSRSSYTTPSLQKMKKIGAKRKHYKAISSTMRKHDNGTEAIPSVILYHLYIHGPKTIQKQDKNRSSSPATAAFNKGKSRVESNTSEVFERENENSGHKIHTGATTDKIDLLYITESRKAPSGNIYFTNKVVDTDIFNDTTKIPTYIGKASNLTDETLEIHNQIFDRFNEINSTLNNDTDDVLAAAKLFFDQRYQKESKVVFSRNEGNGNNESNKDNTTQQTVPNSFLDSRIQYNKQIQGNDNNYNDKLFYTKMIKSNETLDNTSRNNVSKNKNSPMNNSYKTTTHTNEYLYIRDVPRSNNSTSHQMVPYSDTNFESSPGNVSLHRLTTEVTANIQGISSVPTFNWNSTFSLNARNMPTTNLLTKMSKVRTSSSLKPIETSDDILNSIDADKLNLLATKEFWMSNSDSDRSDYQFATSINHYDYEGIEEIRNVSFVLGEILKTPEGRRLKILMNFLRKPDLMQILGPSFKEENFPSLKLLLHGIISRALEVISTQDDVKLVETLKYYKDLLEN